MSSRAPHAIPRVLTASIATFVVLGALLAPARVSAAGEVSFGQPTASADYGQSITFSVDVTSSVPLDRVELQLRFPDTLGPLIVDVPAPSAAGTHALSYTLDVTGGGHLVPNTPITSTWAAYTAPRADPVLSGSDRIRYQDTTKDWQTVSDDLITVHWYEGDQAFGNKALRIGRRAIDETSALLGVTERDPIDFYIYGDQQSFLEALGPGTRENVGGQAHADIRTLFALITPEEIDAPWVGTVVPHELVHLIFDTAVHNPYRFPPRWLNEGLAVYLSEGYGAGDRARVGAAVTDDDLIPLVALGGQFPTDPDKTSLAYAEAVSAIDYLVRTHGRDALVDLVKVYADGLTDDEAFRRALGEDLEAFQDGWLAELGATPPEQFGPRPAPAGPLPSGWAGSSAAPDSLGSPAAGSPAATPGAIASPTPTATTGTAELQASGGASIGTLLGVLVAVVIGVAIVLEIARRRMRPSRP